MPSTIHAAWMHVPDSDSGSQLFVWAEDVEFTSRASTSRTPESRIGGEHRPSLSPHLLSGRTRSGKIPSHPEQLPIGSLRSLFNELMPGMSTETLSPANAVVWLPTVDGAPVLRRSLLHAVPASGGGSAAEPSLCPWQVTGIQLAPLRALLFLAHLSQETLRQQAVERPGLHRLRLGNDLIFWSNAAKFSLELLVGQHYLPSLRTESTGRLNTVWQPFLSDPWVEERRGQLAHTMPPICRAYNLTDPDDAPAPITLIEDFVSTVVDAAVRAWAPGARGAVASNGESGRDAGRGSRDSAASSISHAGSQTFAQSDLPSTSLSGQPRLEPSLAATWLHALRAPVGLVQLPPQPAHTLFQSWSQWVEQLYIVRDANFRICFVLEEPRNPEDFGVGNSADEHEGWVLRYYLQARDNASLMIPAAEVWEASNHVLQAGNRHIDQPQERLLAGLSVAGRLFPPIARSMRRPRTEQANLSTREAYEFLREIAPLLESSGFGVILPGWWNTERRVRLGLRLSFHSDEESAASFGRDALEDYAGGDFDRWDEAALGERMSRNPDEDSGRESADRRETPVVASQLGLNSLVNYTWELTLGGEDLSSAEFEQLTASNSPLLRLRGQWVELDPDQVRATNRFLAGRATQGKTTLLQAIRVAQSLAQDSAEGQELDSEQGADGSGMSVSASTPDLDAVFSFEEGTPDTDESLQEQNLTVDSVAVHGWLERVLDQLRTHEPPQPIPAPTGFKGQLRPYQERGVGWLAHLCKLGLGGCLADDMGLGKTIQAIALILHEQLEAAAQGEKLPPTLLICPTSVVANWRREIERFAPGLRAMVHHGNNRAAGEDFFTELARHDLVVTSYGTARRDIETLTQIQWNDLILDEAQNIKTPSAKQTQAVRRLQGNNRIALTGTPVENRLSELWSIMEFLNPGYLGKHEAFRRRFIIPIERYNDHERTGELRRLVQPFLLRRLKSDPTIISDLPEKNEMVVYCSLTREQAELYEKIVNEALTALRRADGIQRRGLVLALLTKLKQITNHPAHFLKEDKPLEGRSGKLSRLTEMLDEAISVGDRALIFTQFVEMGTLLQRHLTGTLGTETLFLHGGTPANQRDKMVQAFQSEDGPPVFVLSLRAGGSGLNLTQANHVFHYDRWWNPAVENQATDRAFRIGQRRDVQVHKFVVAGTLEERIHDLIENKQALAQSIVGSGEDWLTELETDELRELLMLRQDAIEDD